MDRAPEPRTTLHRLDGDDPATAARRAAVVRLRPLPAQEPFSSRAEVTLPLADTEPTRTPFAVEHDGRVVGFGVIDSLGYLPDVVDRPDEAALLRGFYLDAAEQNRGIGRATVPLLRVLARELVPAARILVLTVNEANPAAVRAYTAGGFVDVGRYLGGGLGPQRVMAVAL
ncbi:GNAT family N-acetyltransferase [Georgenia muralis]